MGVGFKLVRSSSVLGSVRTTKSHCPLTPTFAEMALPPLGSGSNPSLVERGVIGDGGQPGGGPGRTRAVARGGDRAGSWGWGEGRREEEGLCQGPGATSLLASPDTDSGRWRPVSPRTSPPSLAGPPLSGDLPINKSEHLKSEPGAPLPLSRFLIKANNIVKCQPVRR